MPENTRNCLIGRRSLNERQLAALELLLLGKSVGTVAQELKIDPKTLLRWRQDELFIETLEQRRAELFADAAERLRCLVHRSLDVLELQLSDRYDRARYSAAAAVLRLVRMRSEDK